MCGCGDPLLSASDPAATNGRMRLSLEGEYLTVDAANESNRAATDHLNQYTLRLNGVVSPWRGWSLIAQVPLVHKSLATGGAAGSDLTGVGDVELGARYTLLDRPSFATRSRTTVAVSAGTSLPTGSNDATLGGARVDEHGQIGTGSWGPYAGIHFGYEHDRWSTFASVSGRFRTTNGFAYRYGSAVLWSVAAQYWLTPRLAFTEGIDGRWAARDRDEAGPVEDTGGFLLAASPAVYLNATGPFWLSVRAQFPFVTSLYGRQSVGPTIVAGLQYQLF